MVKNKKKKYLDEIFVAPPVAGTTPESSSTIVFNPALEQHNKQAVIEAEKARKAEEQRKIFEEARKAQGTLKADTRSDAQRNRDHQAAVYNEAMEKLDERGNTFNLALGANNTAGGFKLASTAGDMILSPFAAVGGGAVAKPILKTGANLVLKGTNFGLSKMGRLGQGIKNAALDVYRNPGRYIIDASIGIPLDFTTSKAIDYYSGGKYSGFGDMINQKLGGNPDDFWKPMMYEILNPVGIAGGVLADRLNINQKLSNKLRPMVLSAMLDNSNVNASQVVNDELPAITRINKQPKLKNIFNLRNHNATSVNNKIFLDKINDWFSMYGYSPIKATTKELKNTELINNKVKNLIEEHNTFLRGVRLPEGEDTITETLEELGIPPTRENKLIFASISIPGQTGAGRAGVNVRANQPGALYTSNSLETAAGYASSRTLKQPIGEIAKIRRKYHLGDDRDKWIEEGDFLLGEHDGQIFKDAQRSFEDRIRMEKFGNKIKKEIKKDPIVQQELNDYLLKEDVKRQQKRNNTINKIIETIEKEFPNVEADVIQALKQNNYTPKQARFISKLNENLFSFKGQGVDITTPLFKKLMSRNKLSPNEIKELNRDYFVSRGVDSKRFYKVNDEYNTLLEYKLREQNINIPNFAKGKEFNKINVIEGTNSSNRDINNPYTHFVFRGNVQDNPVEFIEFIPRELWDNLDNSKVTRLHIGNATPGFSRKLFRYGGGLINTRYLNTIY